MKKYRQTTCKISCTSDKELFDKVNQLESVGDMPMIIRPTLPDATDTKQWYEINYWTYEQK